MLAACFLTLSNCQLQLTEVELPYSASYIDNELPAETQGFSTSTTQENKILIFYPMILSNTDGFSL